MSSVPVCLIQSNVNAPNACIEIPHEDAAMSEADANGLAGQLLFIKNKSLNMKFKL